MTVKDIEEAITKLPPSDLAELSDWFEKFERKLAIDRHEDELVAEFNSWEAASDEDLRAFEQSLAEHQ